MPGNKALGETAKTRTGRWAMRFVGGALTYAAITAITLVGCEIAYRTFLSHKLARDIAKQLKPTGDKFGAIGVAPWIFKKDFGFEFNRTPWLAASIAENRFAGCGEAPPANRFGNVGRDDPNYERADVKILLVGASFTLVGDRGGHLVNELVAEELSRRTGKRVSMLNFSRDATGILMHMDMVRAKLDELKPNLVLVAANVTQLIYQRHWRVVTQSANGFRRFYFMLDPVEKIVDPDRAVLQPTVINDHITREWCDRNNGALFLRDYAALGRDQLMPQLVSERERLYKEQRLPRPTVDFWRLDRSFMYSRVVHGNAFHDLDLFAGQPVYTHSNLTRFSDDPDTVSAAAKAKARSVPIIPIHIPTLPEMRASDAGSLFGYVAHGVPVEQGESLAADFARLVGEPWVHIYKYYAPALKADPLKLVHSDEDSHPNPLGVHAMADALVAMLLEHPASAPLLRPAVAARDLRN
jgi:hypothetical protein